MNRWCRRIFWAVLLMLPVAGAHRTDAQQSLPARGHPSYVALMGRNSASQHAVRQVTIWWGILPLDTVLVLDNSQYSLIPPGIGMKSIQIVAESWADVRETFLTRRYSTRTGGTFQAVIGEDGALALFAFPACRKDTDQVLGLAADLTHAQGGTEFVKATEFETRMAFASGVNLDAEFTVLGFELIGLSLRWDSQSEDAVQCDCVTSLMLERRAQP